MKNKIVNIIFVFCIFAFLLSGLLRAVFAPDDLNEYENRYANKLIAPTVANFLDGSFQDNAEKALSDQVFFAQNMKKTYNGVNAKYNESFLKIFSGKEDRHYVNLGEVNLFGENLVYPTSKHEYIDEPLADRVNGINEMIGKYKDIDFYVYYIEKDTDINFETREKVGVYEYINENINLPGENVGCFETDNFDDFSENFYKTDHHWNATGSYKGYKEVMNLLGYKGEIIKPSESVTLKGVFQGSKTKTPKTSSYSEEFVVNRFEFPEMDIKINGADAKDYGQQENYKEGTQEDASYSLYYGDDMGEIIFDTDNKSKENILLIGESYDNAILKLVASHFNKTYSIDLRFYTAYMGKTFHLSEYLRENDIKKVLLIGNIDYFVNGEFMPED